MRIILIIFTILATVVISACGPMQYDLKPSFEGKSFELLKPEDAGIGGIYIFRPLISDYLTSDTPNININGILSKQLPFGGYIYNELPVGSYEIILSPSENDRELWKKSINVTIDSKKNTYIAIWATKDVTNPEMLMPIMTPSVMVITMQRSVSTAVLAEIITEDVALPELQQCLEVN